MAKKKPKPKSPFLGRWHIVSMSQWDEDYLNEEVQAFIEFDDRGGGSFQFGYVRGIMDCREATRDGKPVRRVVVGGERRDGPGPGAGLGRAGRRPTQRDDLLPPGRRVRVRGGTGDGGGE